MRIIATLRAPPGSAIDNACRALLEKYDGKPMVADASANRDLIGVHEIEYEVPDRLSEMARVALTHAGYRIRMGVG